MLSLLIEDDEFLLKIFERARLRLLTENGVFLENFPGVKAPHHLKTHFLALTDILGGTGSEGIGGA